MAAPIRMSRALAAVLVDRLPDYFASAEQTAGVALPRMDLRHPDRLSRADAQALYAWLVGQRDVCTALGDTRHPDHQLARGLTALANHFIHSHLANADGEPAPWSEPPSPARAGLIAGTRETIEPSDLTPAEARDMIAWAGMTHEHRVARFDRSHPDHAEAVREFQKLHDRAASERPPAAATATRPIAAPAAGSSQARIEELRAHPGFRDGRHPDHRAIVSELGELLARVPNGTTAATAPPLSARPGSKERIAELNQALRDNKRIGSPERRQLLAELESELRAGGADRIAELRSHPAFRDGRHPEHKSVVAELGDLLSRE